MHLLVSLVPPSYHCWSDETLQQIDDSRRVLALFKQQVGGGPQNPVQLCRCCGAQGLLATVRA
jgi:hypothetical protein